MMKEMVFWGAAGQAKVLRECLKGSGLTLVAVFDNNPRLSAPFADVPLYVGQAGFTQWLAKRRPDPGTVGCLVAIGGSGKDRLDIQDDLESHGLVSLIAKHPTAFVAGDARVGAGSQILAHAAVCVEAVIGRACILNTASSVDHECRLEDGVHVSAGARLAGCVTVGRFAMIGIGAVVLPRLTIGEGAVVGAGAVVLHDVPPWTVVVGNPARVLREVPHD